MARYLDSLYVGDPGSETIGLTEMFSLFIFSLLVMKHCSTHKTNLRMKTSQKHINTHQKA